MILLSKLSPPQKTILGFAGIILVGALLLMLPSATETHVSTNFLTALFTSTSAVCVTGLIVVDTGTYWSTFGQIIIMLLIQIGGLGFMTIATIFALLLGRKIGLKHKFFHKGGPFRKKVVDKVLLTKVIFLTTFFVEILSAFLMSVYMADTFGLRKALFYSLFHSISAFNNAGFDIFGSVSGPFSSLTLFLTDPFITLVIALTFIIGGLGFSVFADIFTERKFSNLTLHSKIIFMSTGFLILFGFLGFLSLEYFNAETLKELPFGDKLLVAFFQAVTPRTAGFNTIDLTKLNEATIFFITILMFIGASPGSTGGGIKNSTFVTVLAQIRGSLSRQREVIIFRKTIPHAVLGKAVTVAFLSLAWIAGVTLILSIIGEGEFITILFETTSAFGTVGLSLGLTPHLSVIGKILIILTMFLGRLGPLTFGYLMVTNKKGSEIQYPEEDVVIG